MKLLELNDHRITAENDNLGLYRSNTIHSDLMC